jgi:type IV secretion system protein VirB3
MQEPIFPAATRPPMKWGVPLMALVALFMPAFVLSLWLGVLVSWWASAALAGFSIFGFFWMRRVTANDDHRLSQAWLAMRLSQRHPNRRLRQGVRSYSPVTLRGAQDVWRR